MLHYDNYDDAVTKLANTICYHDGKAVFVKGVNVSDFDGKTLLLTLQLTRNGRSKVVELVDKGLNYTNFNLGYVNYEVGSAWWFRKPIRQYRQGLKADQLSLRASEQEYYQLAHFGFYNNICDMLENNYPTLVECEQKLKDKERPIVAFHKNFAATWDPLHRDLLLEYQGTRIGVTANFKKFNLLDEFRHLTESLEEIVA